jgi:hypothetical protein
MMGRPIGSIADAKIVTVPINKDWIMSAKNKRYVFVSLIEKQVYKITLKETGDRKLYNKFARGMHKKLYNTVSIYGLTAINVDDPQLVLVSIRVKFQVVNDARMVACSIKDIEKPTA